MTPEAYKDICALDDIQDRFCHEWIIDRCGTRAAIRAGYSAKSARQIGSRLLTKVNIRKRIAELDLERKAVSHLDTVRVLVELSALAHSDIADVVYTKSGRISKNTPAACRRAIASVAYDTTTDPDGNRTTKTKIRMHPKAPALFAAIKMLGLTADRMPAEEVLLEILLSRLEPEDALRFRVAIMKAAEEKMATKPGSE